MKHDDQGFFGCFAMLVLMAGCVVTAVSGTWLHWLGVVGTLWVLLILLDSTNK